ncbi:MAG: Translation initiation factor IF-3 [Verrucomicrobia bacterium ADurb.Bin006]|nr:MAG: Translation initiation factor IF-3 [Verrucomicrobia bacterium ADurb.Bin006]
MPLADALRVAQSKGLDLVEIAPTATPPVCRIVNYDKLKYEEAKNQKDTKNAGSRIKEVQLSASIDPMTSASSCPAPSSSSATT